ncbi:glycerophosphodiester phosphodiesterase family protein [Nocardiopsis coralliicola]
MRRNKGQHSIAVISHRGASGHRPEHTAAAYRLGARYGGDFIEIDLVATADGALVARHDAEIGATTDVAARPEFAERRTTRTIDGTEHTGWFAQDFTLAELKTLRAVERLPEIRPDNAERDGEEEIPTLAEIIALARELTAELGRPVGIYPETKHPAYHSSQGLALEPLLIKELNAAGLAGPEPELPVFLQSFEADSLQALAELELPAVQLIGSGPEWAPVLTEEGMAAVAEYAAAIGPAKELVIARDADGALSAEPTGLVDAAHEAGLLVHPFTFRSENRFLPADLRSGGGPSAFGSFATEYDAFFAAGVDGVFTDHSRHAYLAREVFEAEG